MKLTIHTTSDWTHVETTGTGDPKLWDYSTIPREFNSNIIVETDYVSIWIGKPQYDDTLTEVEVQLVSVNPSDIKINISKGYIGFTSIKVSYWDDEYLEIFRSTHTKTDGDPSHNRFNAKISQAQLMPYRINLAKPFIKQEKQILAIYYPWYGAPDSQSLGRHWGLVSVDDIEQSTDYPILSAYDSQNASLIRNHINIAAEYRVTGFAISWWGIDSYENRAFKKIVNTSNGFKACVYYEINRDGPSMSPEKVASELNYIIENYGYHENYLRYLEKPVILVFDAGGQGRDTVFWEEVRSNIWNCILVGDFRSEALVSVFDGVHIYARAQLDMGEHRKITAWISDQNQILPYSSVSVFNTQSRNGFIAYMDKLTIGTVSPGYDDTEIRINGKSLPRMGNTTYRQYWEHIHASKVDWVLITSWNEWHEGTEIEPSKEHGYDALRETSIQAKKFRES